ncbi:PH domain-containing protein [Arthrobacter cupressi]|uniref:PH domain-containing protein n=1 Tax=Arthrobacter cupressi TaxID=1045773 RepID=UPI0018595E9A|nr:PH domain-containing protein [Arthrobacter cupressi]NYD78193.1 putative membrane protein [Arthrobacter cupressi]
MNRQPPAVDADWHRVHPASPFVRGWVALVAVVVFFGRDIFERALQGRELVEQGLNGRILWLLAGGAALLLVTVAGFILSWYFTRYQLSEGYVRVNTGFLFKQQRQARLDRVQAIDIVQPLLARVFGLAELKFEVADAGESAVRLAYLPIGQAKQLRATILGRAAGIAPATAGGGETAPVPEAPEHVVLSVPHGRLVGSLLLSEQSFFVVLGAVASVVFSVLTESGAVILYMIPAILGLGAAYWKSFNKGFNFTAAISPDGIRLRYGLLDTQAQTVPPGRIQALRITQPPLWRILGWYRIQVNVAGYGGAPGNENAARTTLLPVGRLGEVMQTLALVLPDPGTPDPHRVFTAALNGLDSDAGFTTTPRRARVLAPLGWRRNGFLSTGTALLLRSGRWWRQLVLVPHQRTQSMALSQGPLARRFGVADLVLHTTAGPVVPRLVQADVGQAVALFDQQAARAREARKRQTSEQWLAELSRAGSLPVPAPLQPPVQPAPLQPPVQPAPLQPPVQPAPLQPPAAATPTTPQEEPRHG